MNDWIIFYFKDGEELVIPTTDNRDPSPALLIQGKFLLFERALAPQEEAHEVLYPIASMEKMERYKGEVEPTCLFDAVTVY